MDTPTRTRVLGLDKNDVIDGAVARLRAEFRDRPLSFIEPLVRACRRDLEGSPPGALPELVERLARQRLQSSRAEAATARVTRGRPTTHR